MIHSIKKLRTIVPVHSGETIKKTLLMEIIRQADLELEEFLKLM